MGHKWVEEDFNVDGRPFFETENGTIFGYGHPTDVSELVPLLNEYQCGIYAGNDTDAIDGTDIFFVWATDTTENDDVMFVLGEREMPGAFPIWSVN